MDGTIINSSQTNIQVYATRTKDSSGKTQPNLKALSMEQVPVVGTGSSADLLLAGDGDYIYCGLWNEETDVGQPDSWIIFSLTDKVVQSDYNEYAMTVSETSAESETIDAGFIITVTDGPGKKSPSTTGSTSGIWIILIVLLVLLVVGIVAGVLFLRKPKPQISTNPFIQGDVPLIT